MFFALKLAGEETEMEGHNQIKKVFLRHLERKGLEPDVIPAFLRDLSEALLDSQDLWQINSRLNLLGWDEFELDYRTLELADACFGPANLRRPDTLH